LTGYKAEHGRKVRDILSSGGVKTATVKRQLERVSAVHTKGLKGFDLPLTRFPFRGVSIVGYLEDKKDRKPFTREELTTLAGLIRKWDDDKRYILGIQLNTGVRLQEVMGLRVSDVELDAPVPHILITPYSSRRTKTMNTRKVPLVGVSLWSAQRAMETAAGGTYLFPHYMAKHHNADKAAGSASATLNKWIRAQTGIDKPNHCFRHAMRDRLRDVEAPLELADMIGGWSLKTVGQGYGEGYTLEKKHSWLEKIAI
jgi:integrase